MGDQTDEAKTASGRRAVVAGATGLVGRYCVRELLASPAFPQVVVLTRRPLEPGPPKLENRLLPDFGKLGELPPVAVDAALCALGTTIKTAGSEAAFRAVDREAVVAFATWARRGGATTFVLVSSVGASMRARNFYLRVKGEAEEAVGRLGYPRFVVLRPSLLQGPRTEQRPGEAVVRAVAPLLNPLLLGPLRRYRAVPAETVARAMLAAASDSRPGRFLWEHDDIIGAA